MAALIPLARTPNHQAITAETAAACVGFDIPAKFLDVDQESKRLVFSHRRAMAESRVADVYEVRAAHAIAVTHEVRCIELRCVRFEGAGLLVAS